MVSLELHALGVALGYIGGCITTWSVLRWRRSRRRALDAVVRDERHAALERRLETHGKQYSLLFQRLQERDDEVSAALKSLNAGVKSQGGEIQQIKDFVVSTARAASEQRQREAVRAAEIQEQMLLEQRRQVGAIRQEILERLPGLSNIEPPLPIEQIMRDALAQEAKARTAEEQRLQRAMPEQLFNLQREFVARRRAAQGEEWAGPNAAPSQPGP